jgi:sulfur relay (sulfurtransferase) complex TusBCD TusD component (DsrE family)
MTTPPTSVTSLPGSDTVLLFTRYGLGHAPEDLQKALVIKYLSLTLDSESYPAKILFYTDGVRLACQGSPVLEQLHALKAQGVELVLCQTCLNYFGLVDQVAVGVVGGMGDILEALEKASKVISL